MRGKRVAPEFPEEEPSQKVVPMNVRLKRALWDRLDDIAKKEGRSRNEVVAFFLEWACNDYDIAKAKKGNKK